MYLGYVQSIPSELDLSNSAGLDLKLGQDQVLGVYFFSMYTLK